MGSVETLYDDAGKPRAFLARWRDAGGAQRKKTFDKAKGLRKADAWAHIHKMERAKAERENTDIDTKITVAQLIEQYINLREPDLAENSVDTMRSLLKIHIQGTELGRMTAVTVRWSHVQKWATNMRQGSAKNSVGAALTLVSSGLNMGVRDGSIRPQMATRNIDIKDDDEPTTFVALEIADVEAILGHMEPRRRIIAAVQAHTGVRVQEALGLLAPGTGKLVEVDLDGRMICLRYQLNRKRLVRVKLKTKESRRDISIGSVLTDLLSAYFHEYPAVGPLAFTNAAGEPWKYATYNDHLSRAAEKAGFSGVTSHDLRHHHASVLIEQRVPLLVIARRLGHKGVTQLEKTYGHLLRGTDEMSREALNRAWGTAGALGAPSGPSHGR